LECNNRVFREEENTSIKIAIKCKALLGELSETKHHLKNSRDLEPQEERWMTQFHCPASAPIAPMASHANWEIRLEENEFLNWRTKLKTNCLFFDGTSKGNPGRAGGGGILLSDDNTILLNYAWGLGTMTNNKSEALALWQGLRQAQERKIESLVVIGDSRLVIQAMKTKKLPTTLHMIPIFKKIFLSISKFKEISFYHVLRGLNAQADLEANKEALLDRSILIVNSRESFSNVP